MPFPTKVIINLPQSAFWYCKPTLICMQEIFESLVIANISCSEPVIKYMSSYFFLGQDWDRYWWQGPEGTVSQPEEGEQWTQHQTQTARRWTQERGQASHHHGEWGGRVPVITTVWSLISLYLMIMVNNGLMWEFFFFAWYRKMRWKGKKRFWKNWRRNMKLRKTRLLS